MPVNKIFTPQTILEHFEFSIDGVKQINDNVVDVVLNQSTQEFGIHGTIRFRDTFDLNNSGAVTLNGDNLVKLTIVDFSSNRSTRTYRIVDVHVEPLADRMKMVTLTVVDEITFVLQNTYLSRGFAQTTPVQAFKDYVSHIGVDKLLSNDNLKFDVVDTSTSDTFVVPQDVSVFDFFVDRFRRDNIHIWQDRSGLFVKKIVLSSLVVGTDHDGDKLEYSNKTNRNLYLYKIHDFSEHKNNINSTNSALPVQRVFGTSQDKVIQSTTKNLVDEYATLKMNSLDASKTQLTLGERYRTQQLNTQGEQQLELFDVYLQQNELTVAVKGDTKNTNLYTAADVVMKGNIMSTDSVQRGDVLTSGKYVVGSCSDKIVGDKLIHKVGFIRLDSKQPR